jgi:hypothetical protein
MLFAKLPGNNAAGGRWGGVVECNEGMDMVYFDCLKLNDEISYDFNRLKTQRLTTKGSSVQTIRLIYCITLPWHFRSMIPTVPAFLNLGYTN